MLVAFISLLIGAYLAAQNSWVQTKITNKVAEHLSKRLNTQISVGKVEFGFFNKLYLEEVLIEDQNNDTLLYSQFITAKIDTLRIRKQRISIDALSFENNKIGISSDSTDTFNFTFLLNAIGQNKERDTLNRWDINCNRFNFNDVNVSYKNYASNKHKQLFANDLNLDISDFHSIADSLSFKLNEFSVNDGNKLYLEKASAEIDIIGQKINIQNLNLESTHSEFKDTELNLELYAEADSMNIPFDIHLRIGKSKINFRELGELIPSLKGMNQNIDLSGLIYGNLNDLKGKNVVLSTGTNTTAHLDFYVNDITNADEMYLFLDLKQSETNFKDVSDIRLPNSVKRKYLDFPESFYDAGNLRFKGNFSGFLSDFVTFGTLESEMGSLTTDILVMPEQEGVVIYRGNISTSEFELGQLFNKKNLGKLTFNGSADGNFNKTSKAVSGTFKGNIQEINVNSYAYKNIKFDGLLQEKRFDGLLTINDPNLQFTFLGELDLNKEVPRFDFDLNLKKAIPTNLNLSSSFPNSEIAVKMYANFDGDRIDNINGSIIVEKGFYKNRNGQFDLGGMELKTVLEDNSHSLLFTSNFFDATVNGDYHFRSIVNTFKKVIHHFVPSSNYNLTQNAVANTFNYRVNVKDINELSHIFVPGLEFETPFLLYGNIDSPNNVFQFKGSIPGIKYDNLWARHIFIGNQAVANDTYSSKFRIGELLNRNGMKLYNLTVNSKVSNNVLDNIISWSNFDELTYSGSIHTKTTFSRPDSAKYQHIIVEGLPSQIYIADTLWSIDPFIATIDSSSVDINNLRIKHADQSLAANGKIIGGKGDLMNLDLKNIDLSYFDKYLKNNIQLEGKINGTFAIADAFEKPIILSDLTIDNLRYKKHYMGNISLLSRWNSLQSTIDSELKIVRNNRESLKAFGYYKPSTNEIECYTEIDSLSLIILEAFMGKNFSNFNGVASGKVKIGGKIDNITLNGALLGENAELTVNVTQIPYHFTDSIYFKNNTIQFDNITFYDDENNSGEFHGTLVHQNFNKMVFDLNFSSKKLRALNTTSRDNEQFYGTVVADGSLDITGPVKSTQLTGTATTLRGTDVKISMESESTVEQYDFIEFVTTSKTKKDDFFAEVKNEKSGEFNMSFTVEAKPEAKVQLIYNSQIGDIIKAQGEGILLFEMDSHGNMALSGNYNPTKGDYLFTLQNVLNKRFSIEQGGSVIWSGDPYNAIIDLRAIYKLKASLYDLIGNEVSDGIDPTQRIQVECIISLQEELVTPLIGFDVNFPSADESIKDRLLQYFNTDEEMNKQILSLIVMGKFYTPEYLRGTYEAQSANAIGSTASEMFSNQLSNWLSQIDESWDVGINYRPGNQITDDEIELALSTQIFNDRVTLNGNIGNNTNQYGTVNNNSSQIVGDFEMSVKLVPSGKIQLKAYNRSNNNLIYETAPYTQGVGLSFKEEYNSFDELLKKLGSIFKKKK